MALERLHWKGASVAGGDGALADFDEGAAADLVADDVVDLVAAGAGLAAPKAVTKSAVVGAAEGAVLAEGELTAALRRLLLDFNLL